MKFSDIYGQTDVKRRLIQSVQEGRVPHAQIICGPEGSEKLELALAFAQYVNCTNRTETDSCGVCPPAENLPLWFTPICISLIPLSRREIKMWCAAILLPNGEI